MFSQLITYKFLQEYSSLPIFEESNLLYVDVYFQFNEANGYHEQAKVNRKHSRSRSLGESIKVRRRLPLPLRVWSCM